ncbi:restriction endonuclease subunit S [Staphylococcus delphini]|uniref:restriction endonuclease subunit S n=1 Tax=Staphylococcus delphini TaxID=53344 RepID=UPI0021CE0A2F|nr:restriction endonuclease subunit S [Staphylococcus delphini]UXS45540.1 restriction endonuclease subunit S [Staphylococcus delphini]UXV46162.1 restriction endonuclease subunit S [Staphylococcus delphini]
MTDLKRNVPELRFPEFSEEWAFNIFGDLVDNKSKKYTPKVDEQLIDIELDSIASNTGRLINVYDSSEFSSQKSKFEKNQVLYGKLRPYLNKFHFTNFNGVCSSEIWVLNTKNDSRLKNEFIYNFIQTHKFSQVANQSAGSKMPRADWKLIENLRLSVPSIEEQQKIGDFFSKLDRQIELEEEKLALLEEQKKGYMQKIFLQELRFKDENGEEYPVWEEKKLGEVVAFEKGRLLGKKDLSEEGQFSCILYGELYTTYGAIINRIRSRTNVKSHNLKKAENNQILIPSSGETVENIATASALDVKEEVYIGGDINILIPKKDDGRFISLSLNSINRWDISKLAQGKTVVHLYNSDLKKLDINLPNSIKEQQKIGNFFSKLDRQIEIQSQKIDLLKQRKQGFLQKMFV